jgi:hypothetical protein
MYRKFVMATAAVCSAAAADAANIVFYTGSFTARNWEVLGTGDPAPPQSPLFLEWSVLFDTDLTYGADTSALTAISTNIPSPLTFSYSPLTGVLQFATAGTPFSCGLEPGQFCSTIRLADIVAPVPTFVGQGVEGGAWQARSVSLGTPAVPEPASWALMIAGFGLAGTVLRRRLPAIG